MLPALADTTGNTLDKTPLSLDSVYRRLSALPPHHRLHRPRTSQAPFDHMLTQTTVNRTRDRWDMLTALLSDAALCQTKPLLTALLPDAALCRTDGDVLLTALSGDALLTALSGDALLTALRGPACTGNLVTPSGSRRPPRRAMTSWRRAMTTGEGEHYESE